MNAFLRGEPSQIKVTPIEAVTVLREASLASQRCLDRLLGSGAPDTQPESEQASDGGRWGGGAGVKRTGTSLPMHARLVISQIVRLALRRRAILYRTKG